MDTDIVSRLTRNRIYYVACRVAFLRVFDSLLDEFVATGSEEFRLGYLDRVPLLAGTAPQVQIELLLKTWNSLRKSEPRPLTVEEQVICFAATSELAAAGVADDQRMLRRAARGPIQIDTGNVTWLASRVRLLQVTLPFAPQAAVLQIEKSIATDDLTEVREAGGINSQSLSGLMNLLSRWTVDTSIYAHAEGLLTETELEILRAFFTEYPQLMSS
jgi:hypothetical protein